MYAICLSSPVGTLTLTSDGTAVTGLWIAGQKHFPKEVKKALASVKAAPQLPIFQQAAHWLDCYFEKSPLPPMPPIRTGGTPFQEAVWQLLRQIPYGQTATYGGLSQKLKARGIASSPQAVGGAVGRNPVSILIPCHRVLSADGSLTGYAAGLWAKLYLLNIEGAQYRKYPCPCCGCYTFSLPARDNTAFICPVCMWENDVFAASEDEPSDENHGITLREARKNYQTYGVCELRRKRYAREPFPEELPP